MGSYGKAGHRISLLLSYMAFGVPDGILTGLSLACFETTVTSIYSLGMPVPVGSYMWPVGNSPVGNSPVGKISDASPVTPMPLLLKAVAFRLPGRK